jgi:hypothetical protein
MAPGTNKPIVASSTAAATATATAVTLTAAAAAAAASAAAIHAERWRSDLQQRTFQFAGAGTCMSPQLNLFQLWQALQHCQQLLDAAAPWPLA